MFDSVNCLAVIHKYFLAKYCVFLLMWQMMEAIAMLRISKYVGYRIQQSLLSIEYYDAVA